ANEEVPDADVRVNRLSEQVLAVLEHYKSSDPVGLPGAPIPDPMPIPDMKTSIALGTLTLKEQSVYGLSKFRIEFANSNLGDMEVFIGLSVDVLQVLGNYSLGSFWSRSEGASNITLKGLYAEGIAKLEVAREGHLEATEILLDLTVADIDVHLENRGLLGSMFQGFLNTIGTFVFETMKPFILNKVNTNVLGDVNKNLRGFKMTFPNSLAPVDMGFAEGRKIVRKMGYDPYKIKDFTHTTGILGLEVTQIWVSGLATFHRVGNITVTMENKTVYFEASVGTQQLEGRCHWEISMAGLLSTTGKVSFTIEYLEVNAKVNQSLDVRNRPNLEDLQITLGNFQLQFDGIGTLDYVIEAIVNILPNLLRHQIMLAIEEPLKIKMQEIFSDIDVEKTIKKELQQLDDVENENQEHSLERPPHEEGLTVDESRLDESIF
ncbi:LOW QUALITY PROTEIN: uncharacterized protein LOC124372890, partial [Homalodisca vitripennis]